MNWTKLPLLVIPILVMLLVPAHVTLSEESTASMSDREQRGLRGPVKSCIEESTFGSMTDAEGKTTPEVHSEYTTEYDTGGRILAARHGNSDGSQWVTHYGYDASGRLLKTGSGVEGQAGTETTYSYDRQGRLQNITADGKGDSPVTFRYDEHGRKTKIQISFSAEYRTGIAEAGSPFEAADRAPNLPGGGSATTIYDEHDRATEVQVRDANGELMIRAERAYDAQGRVREERQIWENPVTMFPPDALAKILEQSGLSPVLITNTETWRRKLRVAPEPTGETDPTMAAPGPPSYSEVRHSYQYDQHENWIEKAVSYRSSPDGAFQPSPVIKRKLTYY